MRTISLLTDFGLRDPYVGIMKAVIASRAPAASVIDLSHSVSPQDVTEAAFFIASSFPYFPVDTVHVIVVDPGVGSGRAVVAMRAAGHFFLAPDNGVLTRIMENASIEEIVRVENEGYFLHPVSRTFHGRDIFAPVAAAVAEGLQLAELGPLIGAADAVRIRLPGPSLTEKGCLKGEVIAVDGFGNLITNLDEESLARVSAGKDPSALSVEIGESFIQGLSSSYRAVPEGGLLAIIGSRGYLEISVNQGDAGRHLNCGKRTTVVACPLQPA